ncbi:MAG: dihydrofolate reductase family protein [Solirubrobacteraceae bacterium]
MTAAAPRQFIAAMQVTLDGYSRGPDGNADWVDSWADGLALVPPVDAFVLGGGMFPDYEAFWASVREDPATVAQWLGRDPYPREIEYARVAAETEHLVLSTTLDHATWPTARIVRDLDELRAFKAQPGGAVYVVGGAGLVRSLIDDALLDELRLIVHPVAVGAGAALLSGIARPQELQLIDSARTTDGRLNLSYRVTTSVPAHVH